MHVRGKNKTMIGWSNSGKKALLAIFLLFSVTFGVSKAIGQSSTNGIYGGYVGSDKWFEGMRKSAANQAMMQSVAKTRDFRKLPADYVEFAGRIVFPEGNPFPKKRLPDLRIKSRDTKADDVERAPFVDDEGSFYTVFKKGQTYDLYWMYYFGSRDKFASIYIKPDGPTQRKLAIEYRPKGSTGRESDSREDKRSISRPALREDSIPPANVDQFDLSAFPRPPTNFQEQQVMEAINSATTPELKADAHERLAGYYEKKGDTQRAKSEKAKAEYWRKMIK